METVSACIGIGLGGVWVQSVRAVANRSICDVRPSCAGTGFEWLGSFHALVAFSLTCWRSWIFVPWLIILIR